MKEELLKRTWEEFEGKLKETKQFFIFGASSLGRKFINQYGDRYCIDLILDNSKDKNDTRFKGYQVTNPKFLEEKDPLEYVVMITSVFDEEIYEQLAQLGAQNVFSFPCLRYNDIKKLMIDNESKIQKVLGYLEDDQSKEVYNAIVSKRINIEMDYTDICVRGEFFKVGKEEIFVDAGAFDGDTIEGFIKWVNGEYSKILAFEPGESQYQNMVKKYGDNEKIQCYQAGLWNESTNIKFLDDGTTGATICEDGDTEIQLCKLDDFIDEKITFIKMDIEGAEIEALKGARKVIRKYRPKLAICLYHKPADLWEIPLLVKEILPEYKLYVMHHVELGYDTVLYATV